MEAARALENNNIGAVIVQDQGRVVGITTDRDLAVRVVGGAMDARETKLGQVMTSPVITLSPRDQQRDAVRLMRERNVRRIPLVEDERLAGIVTLDDLLLDEAAPPEELSAVIAAQIGTGGPTAPSRMPSERRRAARAEATFGRMLNRLTAHGQFENTDDADVAIAVVLSSIVRRLTPDEANDLIAQLPSLMHAALWSLPAGPDKRITRELVEAELADTLSVDPARAAEILQAVGEILAQTVTPGQIQDVRGQLPQDMRSIFPEPAVAGAT
jgi:uncharacterized protein (DUF2267 family)